MSPLEQTLVVLVVAAWASTALIAHLFTKSMTNAIDTLRSMMVLQKSESLEQYAAVEEKMHRDRLEAARDRVVEGKVQGERPIAEKRTGVLSQVWTRPPTRPMQPKE